MNSVLRFSGSEKRCSIVTSFVKTQFRYRFYRPLTNQGINLWRKNMGRIHKPFETFSYKRSRPDPKPFPESPVNDYYGRSRLWNPIASKIGIINKKHEDFNWPYSRPPPTGLRRSQSYLPFFLENHFPDVTVRLVIDSVLNNETTTPIFHVPMDMSKHEIAYYLKNIYGLTDIATITVRNIRGRRYKDEIGSIRTMKDYKLAAVHLNSPVCIQESKLVDGENRDDNNKISE